ncbi:MAG: polysaccharide deacetylase family protein [Candidatus Goldiibacteriota bacterium]|jgi:peptidoglycan/xylan/chitin deacetylase (PgdA/CDA1 family)
MNALKIWILTAALILSRVCLSAAETENAKESAPVNVLCYHQFIKNSLFGKNDTYKISTGMFEEHLKFLRDNGYHVISMADFLEFIDGKKQLPEKSVMITIDDGYEGVYTGAYPLLKKYKFPATIFVYREFIRKDETSALGALTVGQILEMKKSGLIEVGSHSYSHGAPLTRRGSKDDGQYIKFLNHEIVESKKAIEDMLGLTLDTMAYPFGAYSYESNAFVKKAGYKAGFSVVPSYNTADTGRFLLRRTIVYNTTNVSRLRKILEKKPVQIKFVKPEDGAIISSAMPQLSAELVDDSMLNTATIHFRIGDSDLPPADYDPATKTLNHVFTKKLKGTLYIASVQAKGLDGGNYEYAWMFMIGRPVDEKVMEKALAAVNKTTGETNDKK